MDPTQTHSVTRLLHEMQRGSETAGEDLARVIYDEIHQLASHYLRREAAHHTLQATELVNEAFIRLSRQRAVSWQNRSHYLGIAAQAIRRVLLDHARRRRAAGRDALVPLQEDAAQARERRFDLIALDEALERLAALDPRQAKVVELRYFAGLDVEETAGALGISTATVKRDWTFAKAWLQRELSETD